MSRKNNVASTGTGPYSSFVLLSLIGRSVVSTNLSSSSCRRGFSRAVQILSIGLVGALHPLRTGRPGQVPVIGSTPLCILGSR